jgi:glutathione S-transferase
MFLWSARRDGSGLVGYLEGAKIGMPHRVAARTAGPFIALDARSRGATDDNVRRAIAAFPGMLQRIDEWTEEGILGGEPPNAADLQIAPSLRLAMSLDDLRPAIEGRPAGRLATESLRTFQGEPRRCCPGMARTNHRSCRLSDQLLG